MTWSTVITYLSAHTSTQITGYAGLDNDTGCVECTLDSKFQYFCHFINNWENMLKITQTYLKPKFTTG